MRRMKDTHGEDVAFAGGGCLGGLKYTVEPSPETLAEDKAAGVRERARRTLIYRDMDERTGALHYARVNSWDYQPTEREIDALLGQLESYRDYQRAHERKYAEKRLASA